MFDRHQAEITVMQFTDQSLPVHQSMSVSWDFYLVPFHHQIRPCDLFRLLAIGMCHFLLAHHFGMACLARLKVKIRRPPPSCGVTNHSHSTRHDQGYNRIFLDRIAPVIYTGAFPILTAWPGSICYIYNWFG